MYNDTMLLWKQRVCVYTEIRPTLLCDSLQLIQANYPLVAVSIKKGQHSEHWPYPVEVMYKQDTIHASLCSEKDQKTLIECVGRQEGVPNRVGVWTDSLAESPRPGGVGQDHVHHHFA